MPPLVSVVLPVYNEEDRIGAAVRSILDQSLPDLEVIVVDDGSTDATPTRLDSFDDPRLHVHRLTTNVGRAVAKNHALDQATGRYVAFMDGDDEAEPTRLETQVAFMEAHPEVDISGTALRTVGGPSSETWRPPTDHAHIRAELLFSCAVYGATAIVRRAFLERHALRFVPGHYVEDYELWGQALGSATFANLPTVLLQHHFVPGDRAIDTQRKQQAMEPVIRAQLRTLGVEPTARQWTMHSALCRPAGTLLQSAADVRDCIRWVDTLLAQNRRRHAIPPQALREVIDHHMVEALEAVPGHRRVLLRHLARSPFARRRLLQSLRVRARDLLSKE